MQIVYLSNRPEVLRGTLSSVARYMSFVDQVVLVVPRDAQGRFDYVEDMFPVEFVFDDSIIDSSRSLDHQARDYLLRAALSDHDALSDEFIMSDDDYRPITPIDAAQFKSEGKYRSYYFYDLCDWVFDHTDFDIGQQNTYQLLKFLHYPHLSYASHMPQIVRRDIFREACERFAPYSADISLCEWATYFNYAQTHHPGLFMPPEPYKTLCWPDCVTCWPRAIEPDQYMFENYSPRLYQPKGPFSGLQAVQQDDAGARFEKILAWYRHEIRALHGKSLDSHGVVRRLLYAMTRPLRRLKDVVWMRERSQIVRLSHRIRQIEKLVDRAN